MALRRALHAAATGDDAVVVAEASRFAARGARSTEEMEADVASMLKHALQSREASTRAAADVVLTHLRSQNGLEFTIRMCLADLSAQFEVASKLLDTLEDPTSSDLALRWATTCVQRCVDDYPRSLLFVSTLALLQEGILACYSRSCPVIDTLKSVIDGSREAVEGLRREEPEIAEHLARLVADLAARLFELQQTSVQLCSEVAEALTQHALEAALAGVRLSS